MGVGRDFSWGVTSGFFQKFSTGAKRGEICFSPLEIKKKLRKQHFLPKFSNSCPSSDTHMLVCRKGLCHIIKKFG